jgi:hypothetical protein
MLLTLVVSRKSEVGLNVRRVELSSARFLGLDKLSYLKQLLG